MEEDELIFSFFQLKNSENSFERFYLTPIHTQKGNDDQIKFLYQLHESKLLQKISSVWPEFIEQIEKGLQSLKDEAQKIYKKEIEIKSSITRFTSEKQEILKKGNVCPTCSREFSSKDIELVKQKIESIEIEIKTKNTDLENLFPIFEKNKKEIEKIKKGIEKIQEKNNNLNENLSESVLHFQKIETLLEKNKEYQKYIKEIQSEKGDFEKNIKDCKKQIEKIENNLKEVKKQLKILNTVKFVVSEEIVTLEPA